MKTGINGIELIKKYEGFMSEPYNCPAGVPTIGYGATYYPNGNVVTLNDEPISKQYASELLADMLGSYERAVNRYVTADITQNQFDALVSFAYNLGNGALKSSTLLKKVNANPCNENITYQFNRWVKAGGRTLRGLVKRRAEEAELYFS
jgi:lysozyme